MEKLKQIERYLDNAMSQAEKESFEKLLHKDEKLASEVNFYRELNESILDDKTWNFRNTLAKIMNADTTYTKPINRSLINLIKIPLAASVLVLVVLSLYHIVIHQDPSKLYTNFYEPYSTDISTRSVENSRNDIQLSYYLYQEGEYQTSYEILKNYIAKNFDDQTAHFYLGLTALELQYYQQAIDEFALVEQDTISPFALHARWYLAMTYLKTDNVKNARLFFQRLAEVENMYASKAKKILKKLKT